MRMYRLLCTMDELADGSARGFSTTGGDDDVFVVRRGDAVYGYRNRCPHNGVGLEYQKDMFLSADGSEIVCYAHGAHFDITCGRCTYGPCLGESLQRVTLKVEGGHVMMMWPISEPTAPARQA
jgi:nitrite reductase/ring-hydroxylating ferredoxin subunit